MCDCKETAVENRKALIEWKLKCMSQAFVTIKHFIMDKHPGWLEEL